MTKPEVGGTGRGRPAESWTRFELTIFGRLSDRVFALADIADDGLTP